MRADRLLSILLLLQVNRRLTSRELARRLEVSERTIHRDMEALSGTGIPVVAERGLGGGWSLLEEYRTNLTGLTELEIQSLFLALPEQPLSDLGLHRASEAALIKLLAALPALHRRDAEFVRQRIHIDTAGWHPREERSFHLPTLQEAIWRERRLHFTYGSQAVERLADPLGLVAKGSGWYLVAAIEGQPRSYRVSRIRSVTVLDEACARPAGFDLAAYWAQSISEFRAALPRYCVRMRIPETLLPRLQGSRFITIEHCEPAVEQGRLELQLVFETEDEARGYILNVGPEIKILDPPELRAQALDLAERIVAAWK
jgi:predicted DNA-binding transcriptional regulator YafY